ncbi:MmgE/PrpD family protein [Pelagicoccus sp. SDUM812002]|uniref:MmgE/PrpD family protein n=1 Tax=Pelagicoccus sp. SDUM812002 TaxID=3041266 RepID=UPI00280D432E|nr:MmgE/PrpD family protein [Pelagicoccus sp. SDUM812002]MDQ8186283.1 MmgE/PrpD family protein [Pelagicoccus sp. SDUM812002]
MPTNLSKSLVERIAQIRTTGLTPEVEHQAKRCLLDYLGAAYAGARMLEKKACSLLEMDGPPAGKATAIGFPRKVSLLMASFVNGLSSHVAEMDDGARFGMVHPGSPILSALLPAAEQFRVRRADLLLGIVAGYETTLRISTSIQPSHYQRGYHPTATCGSIGAAVGLATMLGLDFEKTEHALAAAAVTASGTLKVIGGDSELKPFNTAHAAASAVQSFMVAKAGFPGPLDSLSGTNGFLSMCSDRCDSSRILNDCDAGLWILKIYVKPYAACRHAHPAIEACISVGDNPAFNLQNIKEIKVITYGGLAGRHDHRRASSISSAKMSIPLSVAISLVRRGANIGDFTENAIRDPFTCSLAEKVSIIEDPELTAQVPEKRAALVEIHYTCGKVIRASSVFPKGEPENPMSDSELKDKFITLSASGGISLKQANTLIDTVLNLPDSLESFFLRIQIPPYSSPKHRD